MEFFLGIVFAVFAMAMINKYIINVSEIKKSKMNKIIYRQSHIFDLIRPAIPYIPHNLNARQTQARDHRASQSIKVVFTDDKAYWIKDNNFYEALHIHGQIDDSTTKTVDTMGMDKVELDKIIFIVEKLTEGTANDGRGTGV